MKLIHELNTIIAERHLLTHPFYLAWSKGELTRDTLQRYAAQYYHQVRTFPRFLAATYAVCEDMEKGKVLVENLCDEVLHGTDHPTLWMQFAQGLGLDKEAVLNEVPFPETKQLVDTYFELASHEQDGLCALYAYEYQVPAVAESKIKGLKEFYQITDEKTLAFFYAHQIYDVDHSNKVGKLIEDAEDPNRAKEAIRIACDAQWTFLDGMCREAGIHC